MSKRHAVLAGAVLAGVLATSFFVPVSADSTGQNADVPTSAWMRGIYDLIDLYSDEELPVKAELLREIRQADKLYVQIKKENRAALWRVNHPPQFVQR